jgi:hypothetical protein
MAMNGACAVHVCEVMMIERVNQTYELAKHEDMFPKGVYP